MWQKSGDYAGERILLWKTALGSAEPCQPYFTTLFSKYFFALKSSDLLLRARCQTVAAVSLFQKRERHPGSA